jgi:hypothetical protein
MELFNPIDTVHCIGYDGGLKNPNIPPGNSFFGGAPLVFLCNEWFR